MIYILYTVKTGKKSVLIILFIYRHNVYQLERFMDIIRKSIENKTFEKDSEAFMTKYNHEKEASGMDGHEDEIDFESLGTPIKKNRIL